MQHRKTLSSLIVAPLVIAAIAAPAAVAMPNDPRQLDMHASTVQKSPAAVQDLRSEATADTSRAPVPADDRRSEATVDTSRAPETPVGLPVADDGGDGVDWPVSVLALAGAALLGGSLSVAGIRYRASHSHVAG